jgi:hypothetical protein
VAFLKPFLRASVLEDGRSISALRSLGGRNESRFRLRCAVGTARRGVTGDAQKTARSGAGARLAFTARKPSRVTGFSGGSTLYADY